MKNNINKTAMVVAFLTGISDTALRVQIPEDVAKTVFHDVVADLADSTFSFSSLGTELAETNKRAAAPRPFGSRVTAPPPVVDERNSRNIAALLSTCHELGLSTELNQIVSKLVIEAKTAQPDLFHGVFLPCLKLIVPPLSEKLLLNDPAFQTLFQQILTQYIIRYVQAEPAPPGDWKQRAVGCGCQDCKSLDRFLVSPTERVGRFAVAQKRRGHLHSVLDSAHSGCTHETERRGSPQTLVVTKTRARYQATRKAWTQRCGIAKKHLEEIGAEALKDLLGHTYEAIMALSVSQLSQVATQLPDQATALAPNINASNRVLVPPTRRKVPSAIRPEIIVIGDSD